MSGEIIIRLGGYKEINIYDFANWVHDTYFRLPNIEGYKLYLDRFDINIYVKLDEENNQIKVTADLIDTEDLESTMSENMKRELHEITRGVK